MHDENSSIVSLDPVQRLTRDLSSASSTLSPGEARFLVDSYYSMQEDRIRSGERVRALNASEEPHSVLQWLAGQSETLENQIKRALKVYVENDKVGQWLISVTGIGPVIAAGLLAHIDIHKAPTACHIWRFAGLDPTITWKKGERRPFNARLKVVCWKAGESFVKISNNEKSVYGRLYRERKELETRRNDELQFKDQAARVLEIKNIGKDTEAYKAYSEGKLPPAHIHARAKRYAVKIFLAHLHEVMCEEILGVKAPVPYAIAILHHVDYIAREDNRAK